MAGSQGYSAAFRAQTQQQVHDLERTHWYHSIELPDGSVRPGLISVEALRARFDSFPIPQDLSGKRALDIGAATGWCSFELERRGADVLAVDCVRYDELIEAKALLGSRVEYRVMDMEEITVSNLGRFDYVLFFGVLYHLRHPLLALENVCALAKEAAFVESFVVDAHDENWRSSEPMMKFYPCDELGGQIDNWCGPNVACLEAMCLSAGFARVKLEYRADTRAGFTCSRRPQISPGQGSGEGPWVNSVINNRVEDSVFHAGRDEYLCIYFNSKHEELSLPDIEAMIGDEGAPLLTLSAHGSGLWQANLRLPAWVEPGIHDVRIRAREAAYSQPFAITVLAHPKVEADAEQADFLPLDQAGTPPDLYEVENTLDRGSSFRGYRTEMASCRVRIDEPDLKREHVLVRIADSDLPVSYLTKLWDGAWQANVRPPQSLRPGKHAVRVRTSRSGFSEAIEIERA